MKISQKKLNYTLRDTQEQGGDGTGHDAALNFYDQYHLVRDWSALNRRGLTQTNSKGTPYVFGVNVSAYGSRIAADGGGATTPDESLSDDDIRSSLVTIRFYGVQNTWVYKQAAQKLHKAREKMFKDAGVKKSDRGSYSHTIRYPLEDQDEAYETPVSTTNRSTIAGGTWDHTQIVYQDDADGAYIALSGAHNTEESATTFDCLFLPQLYLQSRGTMPSDTNVETSTTPAAESILRKMMRTGTASFHDTATGLARGEQDNPPYDLTAVGGDASDLVELGRIQFNPYTAGGGHCFIEVPFGVLKTQTQILDHTDSDADISLDLTFECTAIASM
uniref:Uncharacterized protein n=1 Tax=uncultured marine virus TaxID=186617 RepID=S4TEI0_9VIRU|nr:hypothetical protein [uncultured marine virus]